MYAQLGKMQAKVWELEIDAPDINVRARVKMGSLLVDWGRAVRL